MIIVYSKNSVPIRISQERWKHIVDRHPELKDSKEMVVGTIGDPEFILRGDFGELLAVRFYSKTKMGKKYLVAIYKEAEKTDGFLLTAYLTNKLSEKRSIIWKH